MQTMGKVHLHVLPALAEALGIGEANEEAIPEQGNDGNYSALDLLNVLCAKYHRLNHSVFDVNTQKLTGQVVIFLNGRNLELIDGLATRLIDGDTLTLVPFIEGG